MEPHKLSCEEARKIDLVDYLAHLGHYPRRIRQNEYWYISPLRDEKTASFKVNRKLNLWFDHGMGKGGNTVDFGISYHRCPIPELLQRLSQYQTGKTISFHQPMPSPLVGAREKEESSEGKIVILDTRPLAAQSLIDYLHSRKIPLDIAAPSCQEVVFSLYGKRHTAIGFANRSGGYELRSEHFKGGSSPKDVSFFDNRTDGVAVFEGFFNYLSFLTINLDKQPPLHNCLVLNSLAFLEKNRPLMEQHNRIYLLLDRDPAGRNFTSKALQWDLDKYIDRSDYYQGHKDLNEWLVRRPSPHPVQNRRLGRSR